MRVNGSLRKRVGALCLIGAGIIFLALFLPVTAYAVVGQAERFDEFKEEDLDDFHENLVHEEQKEQLDRNDDLAHILKVKKKEAAKADGAARDEINEDIEALKKELLNLPKRDRFKIEMNGQYQYDSNISRLPLGQEKDDSVFDAKNTALFDLSGRKTDLRFDLSASRQWNIEFSEKDAWFTEGRLRYRRRYFTRLTHSQQVSVARHDSKTVEIDNNKIRWDIAQSQSYNYPITNKLSLNNEISSTKRVFPQEAFDQDSNWEASFSPSAFWNFTPKSRISLGYTMSTNSIRSKAGNTNSHNVRLGYFGKVTNKSSASLDVSFAHQIPKSLESATINTVTTGVGYIWQMTAKTQLTAQLIRSLQNSTSNLVSGDVDSDAVTTKSDSYFTNDSLTLSLNSRLTKKLIAILAFNGSHTYTKVQQGGDEDTETTQFTMPFSLTLNYIMQRWLRFSLAYTFAYRGGYEKADRYRDHNLVVSCNISY